MMVLELDWLDASSFSADHALSRAPLYQTQLASDYYDQVLKLQGKQLKVHHLLTHLFDQHPHGLIPAQAMEADPLHQGTCINEGDE
jgi:hypothetical protein